MGSLYKLQQFFVMVICLVCGAQSSALASDNFENATKHICEAKQGKLIKDCSLNRQSFISVVKHSENERASYGCEFISDEHKVDVLIRSTYPQLKEKLVPLIKGDQYSFCAKRDAIADRDSGREIWYVDQLETVKKMEN